MGTLTESIGISQERENKIRQIIQTIIIGSSRKSEMLIKTIEAFTDPNELAYASSWLGYQWNEIDKKLDELKQKI